ncbi:MAG: insulinase family protein [Deltaproteobacteria bacterium]|nr:insulinase family protein [Deltaproteobacteria bacterium]MBN2670872.1 insulinase family protein [Deltaproteobacteria bacterium]
METLQNGVKLISIQRSLQQTVHISVYVKTGSRFETTSQNGISHFLEHMIFRGTHTHRTAFSLNSAFEQLGATINGATTPDSTEYTLSVPKQNAMEGLMLLAQMMTTPHFNEIDTEKKIVIEEILEDFDEQGQCIDIDSISRQRIWANGALLYPITGTMDGVSQLTYEDVTQWFSTHYTSDNMVVCVSGDVTPPEFQSCLREQFSTVPNGNRNVVDPHLLAPAGASYLHIKKPGSQTQLRVAFRTEGLLHPTYPAIEILLRLIDDGMSTPLHRRIFEDRALAYNIGAELEAYEDTGVLNIDALASHENIHDIVFEAIDIVSQIQRGHFSEDELRKAKNRAVWDLESMQDYPGALNAWYGEQEMYRSAIHPCDAASTILRLTKNDILSAAAQIFTAANLFVTTVGMQSDKQQARLQRSAHEPSFFNNRGEL